MITKKDMAWLLIRLVGVAFAFAAPWHVGAAGFSVYVMAGPSEDSGHVFGLARQQVVLKILQAASYAVICFYFVRRGSFVHRMLMKEEH